MTHFINNQWLRGDGDLFTKADPVSGEQLWQGNAASAAQVSAACAAARSCFASASGTARSRPVARRNRPGTALG